MSLHSPASSTLSAEPGAFYRSRPCRSLASRDRLTHSGLVGLLRRARRLRVHFDEPTFHALGHLITTISQAPHRGTRLLVFHSFSDRPHFNRATAPVVHGARTEVTSLLQFVGLPLDNKVRANQVPRSVSRAEPVRFLVVTVNMPSRARSAVVIPDIGLPPNAPCQAPFFLLSPPALKQVTNAFFLLGDSSSIGACRSPGARNDAEEEQIVSFREAGSSGLLLRLVMSAPLGYDKALSTAA